MENIIFIISILVSICTITGFLLTLKNLSNIKSNCINTLQNEMVVVKDALKTLRVDAFIEKMTQVEKRLEDGNKRFEKIDGKFNNAHDELIEIRERIDGIGERMTHHYSKNEGFQIEVRGDIQKLWKEIVEIKTKEN